MTKEIKFRYWNRKEMSVYEPVQFEEDHLWSWEDVNRDNKDGWLMQYTGLKDKNGKEIYEGDILKYPSSKDGGINTIYINLPVCYFEGAFILAKINDDPLYLREAIKSANKLNGIGIEIIGNVYQTPELLQTN